MALAIGKPGERSFTPLKDTLIIASLFLSAL